MANKDDIESDITLELPDNITPKQFAKALTSFYKFIENAHNSIAPQQPIDLRIAVKKGSNLVGYNPTDDEHATNPRVTERISEGLARLNKDENCFEYFSADALDELDAFCKSIPNKENSSTLATAWFSGVSNPITYNIKHNVHKAIQDNFEEYGAIEGLLQGVNVHGRYEIAIYEPLHNKKIICIAEDKELFNEAFNLFNSRVEVEGRIQYNRQGIPRLIRAEAFQRLPEDSELPPYSTTRGILKKYV